VIVNQPDSGVMTVSANGQTTDLGREAAENIFVAAD
jgi:hypothetical protein